MNSEGKITGRHRSRQAVVYLRQSSMAQVREHTESTTRQYGLADEAVRLGWARAEVVVIDTDLGVSGRWGVARAGFTELVSRVCSGEVGAIFGIEISRLARSNAEVARLMEFAAITQTLLIDADGVYDPADVNDRMLLGMKSTLGEVELHVMAQRLHAAKKAAAERGELRTPLPVGLVAGEAGEIVIDPDAEVQAAIRDVFAAFEQTGSAYGVVAAFADRRFPLRAYGGAWAGQLRWGKLTHARVLGVGEKPRLRRGLRARPLHLPPHRRPQPDSPHRTRRAAPRRVARTPQRPPRRLHHLGAVSAQRSQVSGQPHQRRGSAAAGGFGAVSGHHRVRVLRQADAHQLPHRLQTLV
jgi:DNA invertase Pin-like site-specific DNA recombinase